MLIAILVPCAAAIVAGFAIHRLIVARRNRWIEIVDAEGERHRITLPPHSVRGRKNPAAPTCFTTATMEEIKCHVFRSLTDAGWEQDDVGHDGSGVLVSFHRADKRLGLRFDSNLFSRRPLGTTLTFVVAVNVQATSLERELAAIKALGQAGNRDAVEPLVAHLADPRPRIRWAAVSALAVLRDERSVEPLIARLADADDQVRQQAARALGQFGGPRAVDGLIAGLGGREGDSPVVCAWSLGKIRDARAVPALIAALGDPYVKLKLHAALALGEIKDRAAVEPLRACFQDRRNDAKVRAMAFLALKELLSEAEISALLRELPVQPDQPSFEEGMKDAIAESVAEVTTGAIFDIFGLDH